MIEEVSYIGSDERVSQGDIIEFFSPNNEEERYGIIVTGDCDIAQKKVNKYLSFCYISTLDRYFENDYLANEILKTKNEVETELRKRINKIILKSNPNSDGITGEGLKKLINDNDNHDLQSIVIGISPVELDCISILKTQVTSINSIKLLKDLKLYLGKQCDDSYLKVQFSNYSDKIIRQPGDKFYFSHIPLVEKMGFIVNLRRISEIDVMNISIVPKMESQCISKRIGRLNSPYRERMSQKIGTMFSDIALPKKYEEERLQVLTVTFNGYWS